MLGRLDARRLPVDAVVVVGPLLARVSAQLADDIAKRHELGETLGDGGLLFAEAARYGCLARIAFAMLVCMGGQGTEDAVGRIREARVIGGAGGDDGKRTGMAHDIATSPADVISCRQVCNWTPAP